jgi:glycosyltransferase involved in cell wall biosynthesis
MIRFLKISVLIGISIVAFPFFLILAVLLALLARSKSRERSSDVRLVWGPVPIINNRYWSNAMRDAGWQSQTLMMGFASTINKREDFDELLHERYRFLPMPMKMLLLFLESFFRFDVFFLSFNGWLLGGTPYWRLEAPLLKLAGKRIVVIPYGGDAFVYRNIRSTSVMHALMISYPKAARAQDAIQRRVSYWCKQADCVISGFVGPDGFGRWDVLLPNPLQIDTETWKPTKRLSFADGVNDVVYVAHAPNHRGFKGTEFVLSAIEALKEEGLLVELILMEKMQNDELRRRLECDVDILVDQLIFTGHGLNALEGLASCLPVIANLEDESYILPMRRWSYFGECPIVSASPETLVNVLRKLVTRPQLRHQLGCAGRQYVEKYHGYDSAQYLFGNVLKYIYGEVDSIINLYHPLLGEYPKRKARIVHPLVDNHIVD